MRKLYYSLFLLTALFFETAHSQDMKEGFTYLETGKFDRAEVFFKKVLQDYPNNRTAKLCYGRAVGLNGQPETAISIFESLLKEYSDDLEIQLNYAESLLWGKQYEKAKGYYTGLVKNNPDNFGALLGYANTFSNLKEFENAMIYVNKALEVSPNNPNALLSRKYIRLGLANKMVQKQEYEKAILLLDENLVDFPNDRETLMNKSNVYLTTKETDKARSVYEQLATSAKDSVLSLNGLALVAHISEKNKEALKISELAMKKVKSVGDSVLTKQTLERYVQALIWNKKYKNANSRIKQLLSAYGEENWLLSLRATLGMYKSDFKETIEDYQKILKDDPVSFDGNLGSANAYFANGEIKKAYRQAFSTLKIFENQKDVLGFLNKLNENFTPYLEEKLSYTFDNGDNKAFSTSTLVNFPLSPKLSLSADYKYRNTKNTITDREATTNDFNLGAVYKFHPRIIFNGKLGVVSANSFSTDYTQLLGEAFLMITPFKLQYLEIGYKREMQNFNADLVDREIGTNNFFLNYNLGTNFNLGWFTQYFYTTQTDDNTRNLLFTSLYYNFLAKPALKGGVNYQYIAFKNQVPTVYFSPGSFNVMEVFVDLLKDEKIAEAQSWYYGLNAATGFQFIEDDPKQSTYRIQAKLGYKFSERLLANFYGIHSNIASATAAGFTFTELGLRLKWYLRDKPVFYEKLKQ